MKKIICALGVIVTLSIINITTFAMQFFDLTESHWAYKNVLVMQEKGVINGFADGTFRPEEKVTREQFAKMLVKTFGLEKVSNYKKFEDINESRWSWKDVNIASEYLQGYLIDGTMFFYPTNAAKREDVAAAVVRVKGLEKENPDYTLLDRFSDKDYISTENKGLIAIAVKYGIMKGNANGTFNPQGSLTRAEAVTLLSNSINVDDKNMNNNEHDSVQENLEIFIEFYPQEVICRYGMRDKDGNIVVEPIYDLIAFSSETEDIGTVKKDNKYGKIDRNGNIVVPVVYDNRVIYTTAIVAYNKSIINTDGSYAKVLRDGVCGIVDRKGNEVLFPGYDEIELIFEEEKMVRLKKDGKYSYVDVYGKEIISPEYDYIGMWTKGILPVRNNNKYGLFDINGNQITEFKYDAVKLSDDGTIEVKIGEKFIFLDRNGNEKQE